MRGEEELPHLCAVLNELDHTAGGVVDGVAPTDIQFLKFLNVCQVKHPSRGEVLHPEHVQRDEVGSVIPQKLAELIAVHEGAARHIQVGNSPAKCKY